MCLSRDPVKILHFLGMKVEGFWAEPFQSIDALFDYATTCRLFYVRDAPGSDEEGEAHEAGVIGGEEGRKKLKSNDRRRMKGRPVYRRWINDFIPSLRAEGKFIRRGPGTSIEEVRAMVRDEAFATFFVEVEYKQRLRAWQRKRDDEQMKSLIKELVPVAMNNQPSTEDNQRRTCLISAMRKIIMEDDKSFGFDPPNLRNADGFYNTEVVRSFVQDNMGEVGRVAWIKQQERAQEAMRLKASMRQVGEGINGQDS